MKHVKKIFTGMVLMVSVSMLLTSCATIVAGGSPSITINGNISEPVTITTEVQTYPNVTLPVVVKVSRHHLEGQLIKITSENNKFNDIVLDKSVNGWAFGNILLGGFIGWGVDLATNCVSKPSQKQYIIQPLPRPQGDAMKEYEEEKKEKPLKTSDL